MCEKLFDERERGLLESALHNDLGAYYEEISPVMSDDFLEYLEYANSILTKCGLEIWDLEKWREFYNTEKGSFEKIAEDLLTE